MNLLVELVSPERVVFEGKVKSVVLPGVEGDMTILPGHAPLMTMLHPGVAFATDLEGKGQRAFIRGGFVEVTGSKVTILAERVLPVQELTRQVIDDEIFHLMMLRDASKDESSRSQGNAAISRLEEFKASLEL